MLACARIGAIHSIIFGGFSADSISGRILDCESEGIIGTTANIIGSIQANEVLKNILNIKNSLENSILIINLLKLNLRKITFEKKRSCTSCK